MPVVRLSAEIPVLPAPDLAGITRRMGEVTTVEGVVHNIFWVREQTLMITFQEERGGFVAVSFARHRDELNEAFGGDVVQHLRGRAVRITGEISEHEYRAQIIVRSPDQIQLP
ncbi:MAG: hypothetical protein JJU05_10950 [Verrucomicrobia bacterium]|nr:hypothetical protein [Verrucomicrobiota bacterium]MCH8527388.1 hypothetical protein [Kiritimatiellia bacterium]